MSRQRTGFLLKPRCVLYSIVSGVIVVILWKLYINYSFYTSKNIVGQWSVEDNYRTSPSIDVFIFEEHHEAIPYWFNSSSGHLTEKKGLTLIHIDGHSDMGLPQSFRKFPYLRWPKNSKELEYYMQANDLFIISAAMAGMFSKVIWVWPRWDQVNHEDKARDLSEINVGWLMVDTLIPKMKRRTFCFCHHSLSTNKNTDRSVNKTEECRRLPTSLERQADFPEGVVIDRKTCKIEMSFLHEEISEDLAADVFRKEAENFRENGVILDIDEDFYACTFASRPLLNAGFTEEELDDLNEITGSIFCPNNVKEEQEADTLLSQMLDEVMTSGCLEKKTECQQKDVSIQNKYFNILQRNSKHLVCGKKQRKEGNKEEQLRKLVKTMVSWNPRKVTAIKQVGFCLTTSKSRGLDMTKAAEFHVCMGANTPNRTLVIEHNTTLPEINKRTLGLKEIFEAMKPRLLPTMVTLCRSSRDGYVPREFQNKIESDIIESLESLSPLKLHYDDELLGGRKGWYESRVLS